ncbi:diaminopimelate decarboxylase [Asanoa siamensis]|uniref:Diaminopimelate decarboxylase n=1 Tax=Asanoa siamensis TaxID=926357 RepID=A0ABQ4D4F7_9ACTN|nr:diaminopimelate decarboxylase [Asanoa siamensis]GIF78424.1 diaminopimelate decarboxylase [Asanoa siamensis]
MSLSDLIPSLRTSLPPQRLCTEIWPASTRHTGHGAISVGGVDLATLAEQHGTPAYVIDEGEVRDHCREYAAAFGEARVVYAAKALTSRAVLRWVKEEGLGLSVYSEGQLSVAAAVGFPAERIILHGDAKTPADMRAALDYGVGRVVIESASEVTRLAALATTPQRVLIRVLPAHDALLDGVAGLPAPNDCDRFGVVAPSAAFDDLVDRIIAQPKLELVGLDCYVGSQISRFGGYERAIQRLVAVAGHLARTKGVLVREINIGGGHAAPAVDGESPFAVAAFAGRARVVLGLACERQGVPEPELVVTPGRAVVARAGVALYRVVAVRREPEGTQLVAIDGGLSDNPRPALYGARYTAVLLGRAGTGPAVSSTIVGRHDEAGDVLARSVPLPADLRPGDLLAAPGAGAYHLPLASNYNLVGRPPLIAVRGGVARVVVRRETIDDVLCRDCD